MEHNFLSRAEMYTDKEDPYSAMKQDFSRIFYDNNLANYTNATDIGFLDYGNGEYDHYSQSKEQQPHYGEPGYIPTLRPQEHDYTGYGDPYKAYNSVNMVSRTAGAYSAVSPYGRAALTNTKQQPVQEQGGYPGYGSQYYYGAQIDPHMVSGVYENAVDYYQAQDMIDTYNNDSLSSMWNDTSKPAKDRTTDYHGTTDSRRKPDSTSAYQNSTDDYYNSYYKPESKINSTTKPSTKTLESQYGGNYEDSLAGYTSKRTDDSYNYSSRVTGISTKTKNDNAYEDDEDDGEDGNGKGRSIRGLRVLSLKVRDIVARKKRTTYKEVADSLTLELRQDSTGKSSKEESKDEQNVKRRVYDALNVLISAGVLRKEGKLVYCDPSGGLGGSIGRRSTTNVSSQKLEEELSEAKKRMKAKIDLLQEVIFKILAIKNLVKTNKTKEEQEAIYGYSKKTNSRSTVNATRIEVANDNASVKSKNEDNIKFPFIVLLSSSNDNSMNLNMDSSQRQLAIDSKKPFNIFGDIDVLLKMGLHHVTREMFNQNIPYELQRYVPKYYLANLK